MKYTEFTINTIITSIQSGAGRVAACKAAGISYETFTVWMNDRPEFSEQIFAAENEKNESIKETCVDRILTASERDWRAAAWLAERKFPNEYGKRIEVKDTAKEWANSFDVIDDDNEETKEDHST